MTKYEQVRQFLIGEKIKKLKAEQKVMEVRLFVEEAKRKQAEYELRYNHNHDPHNGRFTSGSSGTGLTGSRKSSKIKSSGMYRKTGNSGVFGVLPERMSKKHIREVADKFGIDTAGLTFNIDMNEELLKVPFAGIAIPERIGEITFFPNAFRSEEELVRTIFHESVHVRQYKKYGSAFVQDNRRRFEDEAEAEEEKFVQRCRRSGLL